MYEWISALKWTVNQYDVQDAALNLRREDERSAIYDLDQSDTLNMYVISSAWFDAWTNFVAEGSTYPPPGPISNGSLLENGRAYGGLQAGVDYRIVNAFIWDTFYRMYQGGPELLSGKFQAEVRVAAPKYRSNAKNAAAASELLSSMMFMSEFTPPPPPSGFSSTPTPPPLPSFGSPSKPSDRLNLDTVEYALQVNF
jgi:hypothetical protein